MSKYSPFSESKYCYFTLPLDEKRMKEEPADMQKMREEGLRDLRELLDRIGVHMNLNEGKYDTGSRITFSYNEKAVLRAITRNAGPRQRYTRTEKGYAEPIKIAEIRKQIKATSAVEVAKSLGICKATLYRKIQRAEANHEDYIR